MPTIGQLLKCYFHVDDPKQHAENLMECWVTVLSNLDHESGNHLTLVDIQLLSEHMLDFQHMATDHYATITNKMA